MHCGLFTSVSLYVGSHQPQNRFEANLKGCFPMTLTSSVLVLPQNINSSPDYECLCFIV